MVGGSYGEYGQYLVHRLAYNGTIHIRDGALVRDCIQQLS